MNYTVNNTYLVIGDRLWSKNSFDKLISSYPGKWYFNKSPKDLTHFQIKRLNPRYLFFLHWSWKVPKDIVNSYECICFHMTDVPYGRGGSPLQNLILRGHKTTKLTALRMTDEFDEGPVYMKEDLNLSGNAQDIYIRASNLAAEMIKIIINKNPKPKSQKGKPVIFKRRKPGESQIPNDLTISSLHDFIRMLDADDYPKAFINYGDFRFEFNTSKLFKDYLTAKVMIKKLSEVGK